VQTAGHRLFFSSQSRETASLQPVKISHGIVGGPSITPLRKAYPNACPAKARLKLSFSCLGRCGPRRVTGFFAERIVDVRQSGVGTRGRLVDLRRALHGQRLVRGTLLKMSINVSKRARLQNIGGQAIANFASTETADSLRKGCREAKGLVF
jgi:hypothetical protein